MSFRRSWKVTFRLPFVSIVIHGKNWSPPKLCSRHPDWVPAIVPLLRPQSRAPWRELLGRFALAAVGASDRSLLTRVGPIQVVAAVRRLVEEDVVVRVADRAVAVVGQHDVEVVGERAAALVGHDRVHDRVEAEAAVRRDRTGRALAAGHAVRAPVDAARLVHVVDRVDAVRRRERLAAVRRGDDEVLVLVLGVAVQEADPELAGGRVDRGLRALAVGAGVVRAAACGAEVPEPAMYCGGDHERA